MCRILIIDDEEDVRGAIGAMLEGAGFDVGLASGGRAALQVLAETSFDAVITDILMPDMDGLETITHIRRQYPDVRVIAVSGAMDLFAYGDQAAAAPDVLAMALAAGAAVVLRKPLRRRELIAALRRPQQGRQGASIASGGNVIPLRGAARC